MALPTRNEVSDDLKWDLSRVFKDDQESEQEYNQVVTEIKNLDRFKGNLAKSGQDLYEGITEILSVNRRLEKVYVYATMSSDVDTSNTHYLGLVAKSINIDLNKLLRNVLILYQQVKKKLLPLLEMQWELPLILSMF